MVSIPDRCRWAVAAHQIDRYAHHITTGRTTATAGGPATDLFRGLPDHLRIMTAHVGLFV